MQRFRSNAAPLLLVALTTLLVTGCISRNVYNGVTTAYGLEVMLRSKKPPLGKAEPRGFQQPVFIEPARLRKILSMIEVDMRPSKGSAIRERRVAISDRIVAKMADGLSRALNEASPDQEVVVMALERHMQKLVFDRKTLTSFTAYVMDDELYVYLSRIDWDSEKLRPNDKLPRPHPDDRAMPFTAVTNDLFKEAGSQGVRVDWRNEAFGAPAPKAG